MKLRRIGGNTRLRDLIIFAIHVMLLRELNGEGGIELIEVTY
jgi:hypothetical protein